MSGGGLFLDDEGRGRLNRNTVGYVNPYLTLDDSSTASIDSGVLFGEGVGYVTGDSILGNTVVEVQSSGDEVTFTESYEPLTGEVGYLGLVAGSSSVSGVVAGVRGGVGVVSASSVVSGSVSGSPDVSGSVSDVSVTSGVVAGSIAVISGQVLTDTGTAGTVNGSPGIAGSITGTVINPGAVSGSAGYVGATLATESVTGVTSGAVGYVGQAAGASSVAGSSSGDVGFSGDVSASSTTTGSVTGSEGNLGDFDSVIVSQGAVAGSAGYTGSVIGSSVASGTAGGTAEEITITEQAPGQQPPKRKPRGYVWSFSGDATPIRNPTGMVSALSAAIGSANGSQGFSGVAVGSVSVAGEFTGRRRIREEEDMEILQLLELV
jgi:hypothetical protein